MKPSKNMENLNDDIQYIFQLTRWAFKPLGLWWIISDNPKFFQKLTSFLLIFFNSAVLLFSIIPRLYHVYTTGKTLSHRIILFGPSSFMLSNFIKYILVISRTKIIINCLRQIENDWKIVKDEEERQIMLENSKFGRKMTKLCALFMFSGGYAFNAIMPFWNKQMNKRKGLVKPSPPSIYDHLFNTNTTPAREIIYGIRLLGSTICYVIITAACGLAAMSASHISGHVDIIKLRLQKFSNCDYDIEHDIVSNKIAFIIQCHIKILSFSGRVEKMLREICLIEVLSSIFIICWLGYYCIMKWNDNELVSILTYTILLTSLTLNIFIFCYIGEIFQEQCASIGYFTYMSDWYKISGKNMLSMLLVIAIASYPRRITACGFMDLNIRNFGSIMKTSVAYLNMLRTMASVFQKTSYNEHEKKTQTSDSSSKLAGQVENDIKYSIEINRWILTPLGIWPVDKNASMNEKLLSKALIIICYILMCFIFIPYTLHMFITVKDFKTRLMMCGPFNFGLMVMSKYSFLVARKSYLRECIDHISLDWRRINTEKDREIMLTYAKHGRFVSSLCAMFMYAGGFFYYTARPILAGKGLSTANVSVRVLPHLIYSGLFSAETSPSYEIVFFFQWLSECVRYSTNVAACSLGLIFVLHACGQLEILVGRLENFVCLTDTRYEVKRKIAEINELHLQSMSFIVRIELILSEVCFVEFCGCTINMCLLIYYTLAEFEKPFVEPAAIVAYVILFISFTYNIFIFCYIGEILSQQGQKVRLSAYMINWYELQKQDALGLILLLAVAQRRNTITAGKMAELSYRNFCAILRTALGYFNMLRTVIL